MSVLQPDLLVLVAALCVDVLWGEPPRSLHPVVWIGAVSRAAERRAPTHGPLRQWLWGLAVATLIPAGAAAGGAALLFGLAHVSPWLARLAAVWLLKSCFAARMLWTRADEMRRKLEHDDLGAAREHLSHLCARDGSQLSRAELASATVESIAENASDSIVAPLFWYTMLGLPGALAYRAINTLDARIGYRGRHEWLGKVAARLDDVANWLPARLGTLLLLAAGRLGGADARAGWRMVRRDGRLTESPNAGLLMAGMAGLLGIRLCKPAHYQLGDALRPASPALIACANRVLVVCATLTAVLAGLVSAWLGGGLPHVGA